MTDIIERLRADRTDNQMESDAEDAADEIARLREQEHQIRREFCGRDGGHLPLADALREKIAPLWAECDRLREQLAAAQAREAKLREAVGEAYGCFIAASTEGLDDCVAASHDEALRGLLVRRILHAQTPLLNALTLPSDDSALRERLASEREKCAKVCEARVTGGLPLTRNSNDFDCEAVACANAIRALGDE